MSLDPMFSIPEVKKALSYMLEVNKSFDIMLI